MNFKLKYRMVVIILGRSRDLLVRARKLVAERLFSSWSAGVRASILMAKN